MERETGHFQAICNLGHKTMAEIRRDVCENGEATNPDNVAWVDAENMCLVNCREIIDDIRRDVRENGDDVHPDNIAWVNAKNNLLANGHETAHKIRCDVRENGEAANPDNVAWVDAQNNHLAEIGEQGRNTNIGNWQLELANKAYEILFYHGEEMFYGTDKKERGPSISWRESGKIAARDHAKIRGIGIPNSDHNWGHVKWFLEEIYKMRE